MYLSLVSSLLGSLTTLSTLMSLAPSSFCYAYLVTQGSNIDFGSHLFISFWSLKAFLHSVTIVLCMWSFQLGLKKVKHRKLVLGHYTVCNISLYPHIINIKQNAFFEIVRNHTRMSVKPTNFWSFAYVIPKGY